MKFPSKSTLKKGNILVCLPCSHRTSSQCRSEGLAGLSSHSLRSCQDSRGQGKAQKDDALHLEQVLLYYNT